MEIPPGGNSEVEVTFTAPKGTANIRKTVTIEFADPKIPRRHFSIKAEVVEPLAVLPDKVMLGAATPGQAVSGEFVVGNYSDTDIPNLVVSGFPESVTVVIDRQPSDVKLPGIPRQI